MKNILVLSAIALCINFLANIPSYAADEDISDIITVPPTNAVSYTRVEIEKTCALPFLDISSDDTHKSLIFGNNGDYTDCKVLKFKEIGKIGTEEFWGATYHLISPASKDIPSTRAVANNVPSASAVFVRNENSDNYAYLVGMGLDTQSDTDTFKLPQLEKSPDGYILTLPESGGTSYDQNGSLYYYWRNNSWYPLDTTSWKEDLNKKLPKQFNVWNGYWPEFKTLTVENYFWRKNDAHCCPTGGSFTAQLGIIDDKLILKSVTFDKHPDGKDDQTQ